MHNSSEQIQRLLENSRTNEAIAKKLFHIETEILSCKSSDELLQKLLNLIKIEFGLKSICLLMVNPMPIKYLLRENINSNWQQENCHSITSKNLAKIHSNSKPLLTNKLFELNHRLPKSLIAEAKSIALIPLMLEGKLFASLLFTDGDENRFHADLGTYHLEQLSVKISLCLSNVLIREQLEYMANYDRLTGVANRRLMEVSIKEELTRQERYNIPFSVLFIDCNKFKQINDTYGHDCGDKVLTYVANQIKGLIRENDKCFRYAGDEFVVTLASQGYREALQVANRLTEFFLNTPMPYLDETLAITISCGAATSDGKKTMDELLKQADQQLYLHKKTPAI